MTNTENIRARVAEIAACASVSFAATYVGPTMRDQWACDAWRCTLTYLDRKIEEFEFFTGVGLRAPATKFDENRARMECYGVSQNDISRGTVYGRRYLALVESFRKPAPLHVADLIQSLILDASAGEQSFSDWCADYGYSDDSLKAQQTYFACQSNANKLQRVFGRGNVSALRDALQDY